MVGLTDSNHAMAVDHIRYDILTQDALRGVVRTVLEDAARNGLPGEHHFYISFDPRAEGVKLSQRMRAQYPEEMTIVLQHQFWDLMVTEDRFEVGLSFGGVPERVVVPFAAIKSFVDPSVQFGVQFEDCWPRTNPSRSRREERQPRRRGRRPSTSRRAPEIAALPAPANPPPRPPDDKPAPGKAAARSCGSTVSARSESRRADRATEPMVRALDAQAVAEVIATTRRTRTETDTLRSDRGAGRPLLGRADRALAPQFPHRRGAHAAAADPRARHRSSAPRPR